MGRKLDRVVKMVQTLVRRVIRTLKMIDSKEDLKIQSQGGGDVTRTSWVILIREPKVPSTYYDMNSRFRSGSWSAGLTPLALIGSQMAGMSGRRKGLMRPPAPVNLAENLPWPPVGGLIGPNLLGLVDVEYIENMLIGDAHTSLFTLLVLLNYVATDEAARYDALVDELSEALKAKMKLSGTGVDEAADEVPDLYDFIPPLLDDM
ncbi:hypothetical protein NE237_012151 [Protea cynaroides]|uniref:Uncharacterized protein n=1 Tax=Protea cynaroides TaxID=273540 RepID=A0A9Q0JYY8_9MAGN|nr:hypothetical protein NE237_012151 [Protea cynaroides]